MSEQPTLHWHISTQHMPGTPDYPSDDAVYIYLTGCARELLSTKQDKEYRLTQSEHRADEITCKPCKIWAKYYSERRLKL